MAQVFAVRLSAFSTPLEARVVPSAAVAYIEPRGVVKLAYPEFSGLEGHNVRRITLTSQPNNYYWSSQCRLQ